MFIEELFNGILQLKIIDINNLILNLEKKLNISNNLNFFNNSSNVVEKEEDVETTNNIEIILQSIKPDKKISVLKTVKSILKTGLKETKDIIENLPSKLKETINIKEAEEIKNQIELAGGLIELKKK